jgi:DNA-binding HxlR family transcriptional regulator
MFFRLLTLMLTSFARKRSRKQLSAKISRHLLLLRKHGVIRKLPRQNRYQLTVKGMRLVNALHVLLDASTENLLKNAA